MDFFKGALAFTGLSAGEAVAVVADVKITSHAASAPLMDAVVAQLISSISDKEKSVRGSCVESLVALGQQHPPHVISALCIYLQQQWSKLHSVHVCLCLKALVGILTEVHEEALRHRSSSAHATILEAASLFAALLLKDPPQDAQPLLVEAFALSGSVNSDHAVACILSRVPDASLPSPPLLLAAASCAALCGSKFDQHIPVILSKILPCLSVAKSDGTRAVIATLAARFSECAASSRAAGGSISCSSELGIIFDAMVRTWLPSLRAIDAREAVCESVGFVAGVVSPDVVEPVLPLLLQFLTTTMRSSSKDIAKHVISKSLALIIEAVASACGRSFMMHTDAIFTCLHAQTLTPINYDDVLSVRHSSEVMRCFENISRVTMDATLQFLLLKIQSPGIESKIGALSIIRHLTTRLPQEMQSRKETLVACLLSLLSDSSILMKRAIVATIPVFASAGLLACDGAPELITFHVAQLSSSDAELSSTSKQSLIAAASFGNNISAWPHIVEHITSHTCRGAVADVCRAVAAFATSKFGAKEATVDFNSLPTLPRPYALFARFMVLMTAAPASDMRALLECMRILLPCVEQNVSDHVSQRLPQLLAALDEGIDPKKWTEAIFRLFSETVDVVEGIEWRMGLAEALVLQVLGSDGGSERPPAHAAGSLLLYESLPMKAAGLRFIGFMLQRLAHKPLSMSVLERVFKILMVRDSPLLKPVERAAAARFMAMVASAHIDSVLARLRDVLEEFKAVATSRQKKGGGSKDGAALGIMGGMFGLIGGAATPAKSAGAPAAPAPLFLFNSSMRDAEWFEFESCFKITMINMFALAITFIPCAAVRSRLELGQLANMRSLLEEASDASQRQAALECILNIARSVHKANQTESDPASPAPKFSARDEFCSLTLQYLKCAESSPPEEFFKALKSGWLCVSGLILAAGPPSKSLQRDIIQSACSALHAAHAIMNNGTVSAEVSSSGCDALDATRRGLETVARSAPSLSKVMSICHAATASVASRAVDASLITAMSWAQTIAEIPGSVGPVPPALMDKAAHVLALAFCSCVHDDISVRTAACAVLIKMFEYVSGEKLKENISKVCEGLISAASAAGGSRLTFATWSPLQSGLCKVIDHITSAAGPELSGQIVSSASQMLGNLPCAMRLSCALLISRMSTAPGSSDQASSTVVPFDVCMRVLFQLVPQVLGANEPCLSHDDAANSFIRDSISQSFLQGAKNNFSVAYRIILENCACGAVPLPHAFILIASHAPLATSIVDRCCDAIAAAAAGEITDDLDSLISASTLIAALCRGCDETVISASLRGEWTVRLSEASVKQLVVRMIPAVLVCIDNTAAAQAAIERENEELKKKGKKRDPKDDLHDFFAARAAFCDSLDAVMNAVGMKGICDVLKSNANGDKLSPSASGSGGDCHWGSLTTGYSLDATVANILVALAAQYQACLSDLLVQLQTYSVAPGGRGFRPCIIAACGGFMNMCDNSATHLTSLLSVIQNAAAASESPTPKKDTHDAADDARRCAISALGSIVQLKDSSKHLRNVIATLLQALSNDAVACEALQSLLCISERTRPEALAAVLETVCASVVPLMSFHIAKHGYKASDAAARECRMRSMAFNIFACASRCAGVAFSSNLRVSLQAGLVHALLRCCDDDADVRNAALRSCQQVIGVLIDFDIGSDRLFAVGCGRMLCFFTSRVPQNPYRLVRLFESHGPGVDVSTRRQCYMLHTGTAIRCIHTDLNVATCLEECSCPQESVRAAAIYFATAIAQESNAQRPAKHDFSEIIKAVVNLMAKDSSAVVRAAAARGCKRLGTLQL